MRLLSIFLLTITATFTAQSISSPAANDLPIIHEIYQLVDQRSLDTKLFSKALQAPNITVQQTALIGLGRIGGKAMVEMAASFLNHEKESLRKNAAFALGISGAKEAADYLWQALENETSAEVKKEIYLGLGKLGQDGLISKMMLRLKQENNHQAKADLFQALGMTLVFHSKLQDDFSQIDYPKLLSLFATGDNVAANVGLFLDRIPQIEKFISADQLVTLTKKNMSPLATNYLLKLIAKITVKQHASDRILLAWLIEKTESHDLNIKVEATRSLKNLMIYPQTLIQLGKLHASSHPVVSQTALKVIADSKLNTIHVIKLLKKQLKSQQPAMVVEAMSGLIKRQNKDDMSWVLKIFHHPSSYVKIKLIQLLNSKSKTDFKNVTRLFSQAPNKQVSDYAKNLLSSAEKRQELKTQSEPYKKVVMAFGKKIQFKTNMGSFTLQLLSDAPYTSWHFLNNVQQGVYINTYFNRVIGNFVAQGGDSIGDGEGSTGRTIREEINFLEHQPMTVGMATSGKDTGTSQFFINTTRNLHLDRNYTIFAKVIAGQESILMMTNGAKVLSAKIVD